MHATVFTLRLFKQEAHGKYEALITEDGLNYELICISKLDPQMN